MMHHESSDRICVAIKMPLKMVKCTDNDTFTTQTHCTVTVSGVNRHLVISMLQVASKSGLQWLL